jgi:hypothetical protein
MTHLYRHNQGIAAGTDRPARILLLYENGEYDHDMLIVRKLQIEKEIADLQQEKTSLQEYLDTVIISDAQLEAIDAICAEIEVGLDNATFEDKKRYFELLDVRGVVALEDGKEVVYAKCKLVKQQRLQMQTWPSHSDWKDNRITVTARLVIQAILKSTSTT